MNTIVTTPLTFEQKISDKIRDSIGDLITEEDLSKLVSRSVNDIFFNQRPNPKKTSFGYGSNESAYLPPLFHDLIKELMPPLVKDQLKQYLETNKESVMNIVNEVVTAGVGNAVLNAMNLQFQTQLISFQANIQNQLSAR